MILLFCTIILTTISYLLCILRNIGWKKVKTMTLWKIIFVSLVIKFNQYGNLFIEFNFQNLMTNSEYQLK